LRKDTQGMVEVVTKVLDEAGDCGVAGMGELSQVIG
jgi:hypothetical protein